MFGTQSVPELDSQLRQVLKYSGFILIGICLGLFFYPEDAVLWGMVVGTATGIYNSIMLTIRIKRLPDLSPEAAKKHMKKGLTMRLSMIMAVLFLVSQKLTFISLFGMGAGLLIPYCVSIIISVVENFRLYRQSEAFARKYYDD
ncbi:MAG: ATP synthase subunit I [Desulfocucumaceae bacterium]